MLMLTQRFACGALQQTRAQGAVGHGWLDDYAADSFARRLQAHAASAEPAAAVAYPVLREPAPDEDWGFAPWFFGPVSRDSTYHLLNHQQSGCFLIRASRSRPDEFALSLKHGIDVSHIRITKGRHGHRIGKLRTFATIADLVAFYTRTSLHEEFDEIDVVLTSSPPKEHMPTAAGDGPAQSLTALHRLWIDRGYLLTRGQKVIEALRKETASLTQEAPTACGRSPALGARSAMDTDTPEASSSTERTRPWDVGLQQMDSRSDGQQRQPAVIHRADQEMWPHANALPPARGGNSKRILIALEPPQVHHQQGSAAGCNRLGIRAQPTPAGRTDTAVLNDVPTQPQGDDTAHGVAPQQMPTPHVPVYVDPATMRKLSNHVHARAAETHPSTSPFGANGQYGDSMDQFDARAHSTGFAWEAHYLTNAAAVGADHAQQPRPAHSSGSGAHGPMPIPDAAMDMEDGAAHHPTNSHHAAHSRPLEHQQEELGASHALQPPQAPTFVPQAAQVLQTTAAVSSTPNKFCTQCGTKRLGTWLFCGNCGARCGT